MQSALYYRVHVLTPLPCKSLLDFLPFLFFSLPLFQLLHLGPNTRSERRDQMAMHGRQDDQVCGGPSSMIGGVILIINFQFISSAQRGTLPLDLLLVHAARPFLYYLSRRTGFRDSTRRLHHHFANRTLSNHTIRYLLPLSFF